MKCMKRLKEYIIAFILLISIVTASPISSVILHASDNKWNTEDITLPVALKGSCVEYLDNKIYVIGGDKVHKNFSSATYIYDFTTNTWSAASNLPEVKAYAQSVIVDNKIYVIGGGKLINGKFYSTNTLEIYDTKTNQWSTGMAMPLSTGNSNAVVYQNRIYVFGGLITDNDIVTAYHKSIQIYDIKTDTWITKAMPFARYGFTVEKIHDKVYLIGGHDGSNYCKDVKIYDFKSNKWSDGADKEYALSFSDSVNFNNKIYVMGGNYSTTFSNHVEVYDVITNTWSKMPSLNEVKRFFGSVIHNNRIYTVGGDVKISQTATNTIESYPLPPEDNRIFAHLYTNEKAQISFTSDLVDNQTLIWKSSSPSVATVDERGKVTAVEEGTTFISAYNQNGTFLDYIPVIVTGNNIYRMAVHLNTGQKQKLYVKGNPSDITWSSMDPSVVSVSTNGEVTGVSKGLAIVQAEIEGKEQYLYIRVN